MPIINSDLLIFSVSSAISLFLVIKGVPTPTLLQINATLILVLLLSYRQFGSSSNQFLQKLIKGLLLLVSSALVQILVLATGGFFSPFLILLHIYTLGSSFLLNLTSSVTFLVFSVVILITHIIVDPRIKAIFLDDPWSVVLLSVSFLVIIPLAQYLIKTYRIKDTLSKLLHQKVQTSESILGGVSELIVITETNTAIVSINDVGERLLRTDSSVAAGQPLLEIVPFKNSSGNPLTSQTLPIAKVLENKINYIVRDVYLENVFGHFSKVNLQIRPIQTEDCTIKTLAFVISENLDKSYRQHDNLEPVQNNYTLAKESLRSALLKSSDSNLLLTYTRLCHIEEDLNIAKELSDHTFKATIKNTDLLVFCQSTVATEANFLKELKVSLSTNWPMEPAEESLLRLKQSNVAKELLPVSTFSTPIDENYLRLIIRKLIELSAVVSFKTAQPTVELSLERVGSDKFKITFKAINLTENLTDQEAKSLLTENYGNPSSNRFISGSGLEGYIAKLLSLQLHIPIKITFNQYSHQLIIELEISKSPY